MTANQLFWKTETCKPLYVKVSGPFTLGLDEAHQPKPLTKLWGVEISYKVMNVARVLRLWRFLTNIRVILNLHQPGLGLRSLRSLSWRRNSPYTNCCIHLHPLPDQISYVHITNIDPTYLRDIVLLRRLLKILPLAWPLKYRYPCTIFGHNRRCEKIEIDTTSN